jgi:hypothetical protein
MATKPNVNGFEETTEVPAPRVRRQVSDELLALLAGSAERGTAWVKTASPDEITELKKDLGSGVVRAKYKVTVESEKVDDNSVKLKFSATVKPEETPVPAEA